MREIFKRVEDKNEIDIEVELDISPKDKKIYRWLFSVFIKFNPTKVTQELYEDFLDLKESLIIATEYEDSAKYVGMRVVDGWSEFYFYAKDAKDLSQTANTILQQSSYAYESSVVRDAKWNFYYKNLLPNELEYIDIESLKIISMLKDEGDSLTTPREVEHYISFDVASLKEKFLQNLPDGFSYLDDVDSQEFSNGVAITKIHSVTYEDIKEVTHNLYEALKKEHGYYEGWSTTLIKD